VQCQKARLITPWALSLFRLPALPIQLQSCIMCGSFLNHGHSFSVLLSVKPSASRSACSPDLLLSQRFPESTIHCCALSSANLFRDLMIDANQMKDVCKSEMHCRSFSPLGVCVFMINASYLQSDCFLIFFPFLLCIGVCVFHI
jgi:hypothetical protein